MDPSLLHQAAGAYQRQPTLIPPRDAVLGLHPELMGRPYPPELAHHVCEILIYNLLLVSFVDLIHSVYFFRFKLMSSSNDRL